MPRRPRLVLPHCPHHLTQRGNYRQAVFIDDADRNLYLDTVWERCQHYHVQIVGYCLMTNHTHWIVIPSRAEALSLAFGQAHNDYSRWFHLRRRQRGHLWQSRFYSCLLDTAHLWEALRYVELNPVRAGLVERAENWR